MIIRKRLHIAHRTNVGHCQGRPPDDGEEEFTLIELPNVVLMTVVLLAILVSNTRKIQESLLNA
jgi:hypothetical protein